MKSKHSCIILVGNNKKLNKKAIAYLGKYFLIKRVVNFCEKNIAEVKVAALDPEYVFNFLSDKILKGPLLKFKCINFHPAPPNWPGRGSASLALFHGEKHYGATAHIMDLSVDAGKILMVERFPILRGESCESVFDRGMEACLKLFKKVVVYIAKHSRLPDPCGQVWKRKPMSKKEFQKWLVLDPKNKKEFIRKIKAAKHSKFSGPYVMVYGYKFGLVLGKDRENICKK